MKFFRYIFIFLVAFGFWHSAEAALILQKPTYTGLNQGLVGYWSFDGKDMLGGTVYDRSGYGNNGSKVNMATSSAHVQGKIGQALSFDGCSSCAQDDYINAGAGSSLTDLGPMTVSAWINPQGASEGGEGHILRKGSSADNWYVSFQSTLKEIRFFKDTDAVNIQANSLDLLSFNKWQHIIVTWDGTANSNSVQFYLDSVNINESQAGSGVNVTDNTLNLTIGNNSTAGRTFNGNIDDVRIYNRILTKDEVKRLYKIGSTFKLNTTVSTDSLTKGLVGHWTFDGKDMPNGLVKDVSGNGLNGSMTNMSTSSAYVQGKMGQALKFDGSNDYIQGPQGSSIGPPISMCAWFKVNPNSTIFDNLSQNDAIIELRSPSFIFEGFSLRLRNSAASTVVPSMAAYDNQDGSGVGFDGVTNLQNNREGWHHYCGIFFSNTQRALYMDSRLENSGTVSSEDAQATTIRVGVETEPSTGVNLSYADGTIDDVRVYDRALSADEIKRLYRIGATLHTNTQINNDSLSKGLVGYWSFDGKDMLGGTVYDRSGQGNNGSMKNMSTSTAYVQGKIGQALSFDGINSYIDLGTPASLDVDTAYTISAWVYTKTSNTSQNIVVLGGAACCGGERSLSAYFNAGGGTYRFANSQGGLVVLEGATTIQVNRWYHVLGTWDGSTIALYVDGARDASQAQASSLAEFTNQSFIGSTDGTSRWNGYIDDVRIYNRALTADEIKRLYNLGR